MLYKCAKGLRFETSQIQFRFLWLPSFFISNIAKSLYMWGIPSPHCALEPMLLSCMSPLWMIMIFTITFHWGQNGNLTKWCMLPVVILCSVHLYFIKFLINGSSNENCHYDLKYLIICNISSYVFNRINGS